MTIRPIALKWLDRSVVALYFACLMGVFATSMIFARGLQEEMRMKITDLRSVTQEIEQMVQGNAVRIEASAVAIEHEITLITATEKVVRSNAEMAHGIEQDILAILGKLDVEPDGWRGSISSITEEIKQCVCGDAEKVGADG